MSSRWPPFLRMEWLLRCRGRRHAATGRPGAPFSTQMVFFIKPPSASTGGRPIVGEQDGTGIATARPADKSGPGVAPSRRSGMTMSRLHQIGVGNAGQPFERPVAFGDDQRFAMRIGAGHHQQQDPAHSSIGAGWRPAASCHQEQQVQGAGNITRARPNRRDAGQFARAFRTHDDAATLCSNASSPAPIRALRQRNRVQPHHRKGLASRCLCSRSSAPPRHCAHRRQDETRRPLMATIWRRAAGRV